MAGTWVQDDTNIQDSGPHASVAKAFGSSVTANNHIVVTVCWGTQDLTAGSGLVITDNQGNTYAEVLHNWDGQGMATWWAKATTGGSITVTATFTPACSWNRFGIMEVSGLHASSPIGQTASNIQTSNSGTDGITSGSVTTGTANEFIYGVTQNIEDGGAALSAGTNYTLRETITGIVFGMETRVLASAGSVAATFTWASGSHKTITHIVTFKEDGGGGETITVDKWYQSPGNPPRDRWGVVPY